MILSASVAFTACVPPLFGVVQMQLRQSILDASVVCVKLGNLLLENGKRVWTRIVGVREAMGVAWADLIYSQCGGWVGRTTFRGEEILTRTNGKTIYSDGKGLMGRLKVSRRREHVASRQKCDGWNSQTEGTQTIAWTAERIAVGEPEGMDSFKLA